MKERIVFIPVLGFLARGGGVRYVLSGSVTLKQADGASCLPRVPASGRKRGGVITMVRPSRRLCSLCSVCFCGGSFRLSHKPKRTVHFLSRHPFWFEVQFCPLLQLTCLSTGAELFPLELGGGCWRTLS